MLTRSSTAVQSSDSELLQCSSGLEILSANPSNDTSDIDIIPKEEYLTTTSDTHITSSNHVKQEMTDSNNSATQVDCMLADVETDERCLTSNEATMRLLLLQAGEHGQEQRQFMKEQDISHMCAPTLRNANSEEDVRLSTSDAISVSLIYDTNNTINENHTNYHSILKRKSIPLSMKKEAIEWISGPGKGIPSRAEKHFSALDWDVSASSFRKWWKNRDKIMRDASNKKRIAGGGRKPYLESNEEKLLVSVIQERAKKDRVTRKWIAKTAQQMFQHSNSNFKASENWVTKFIRRNGLTLKRSYVTYPIDEGMDNSMIETGSRDEDEMLLKQNHMFTENSSIDKEMSRRLTSETLDSNDAINSLMQHSHYPSPSENSVESDIVTSNALECMQGRAVV